MGTQLTYLSSRESVTFFDRVPVETKAEGYAQQVQPIRQNATLPFVIPTAAQRSGGICGAPPRQTKALGARKERRVPHPSRYLRRVGYATVERKILFLPPRECSLTMPDMAGVPQLRKKQTCLGETRELTRGAFVCRGGAPQIPPLRCATVGMTKGRVALPLRAVAGSVVPAVRTLQLSFPRALGQKRLQTLGMTNT
jgi:hypothetical protein